MTRPLPRPALDEVGTAFENAKCPKCGGELRFDSDRLGYGQTIEQCEHVARCGYWRTLEGPRIPAHTRAPKGEEKRPAARRRPPVARADGRMPASAAPGALRCSAERFAAVLLAVPVGEAAAITAPALAERAGVSTSLAINVLTHAHAAGTVGKRNLPRGLRGRPPVGYWRRAA
jgi:ribosomal protein S25